MTFTIGGVEFDLASPSFYQITTLSVIGLFVYYLMNPEKFEKLVALINKYLRFIYKSADYAYIKYDIQGSLNDYIARINRSTRELDCTRAKIEWIDMNQNAESFIRNGNVVIRMQKSANQNKNLVNASMAFISTSFLSRAKSYISKSQRQALDLFVCYDLLKVENREIMNQFLEDFLRNNLEKKKIADIFDKFTDIQEIGAFYAILVQELRFLGEKVFARKTEFNKIVTEVTQLINLLYKYSNRKLNEHTPSELTGEYCKFAIRIIGHKGKVETEGTKVYVNHLKKIAPTLETIYLISPKDRWRFTAEVYNTCKNSIGYSCLRQKTYNAKIKDKDGNEIAVSNFIMVLRNDKIKSYHRN